MKVFYYTDDGKRFEDKDEALAHELELKELEEKKRKLKEEKEARLKAVKNAEKEFYNLMKEYEKEYGESYLGTFDGNQNRTVHTEELLNELLKWFH